MRRCFVALFTLLALGSLGCQTGPGPGYASFGARFGTGNAKTLAQAVDEIDRHAGKPVCVTAIIDEVCKKRGCWMMLTDGQHRVRVRFTASEQCTDGFLLPRNADGHTAYARGMLLRTTISEELARHYAKDEGRSDADIAEIVGPQPAITMTATGVMISDAAALDPPLQ